MANNLKDLTDIRPLVTDPSCTRLWVVSSIDGNLDKIEEAILEIENHSNFCENDKVIFMGNFIGISNDNKEVITLLREYQKERPNQVVILRGAEEHKCLRSKKSFFTTLLGHSIAHSYTEKTGFSKAKFNLKRFLEDRKWLNTLPSIYETNRFFFVHSGIVLNNTLAKQNPLTTTFLHELSFKTTDKDFGKIVVHADTLDKNEYKANRIGISVGLIVLNDTNSRDKILELNT